MARGGSAGEPLAEEVWERRKRCRRAERSGDPPSLDALTDEARQGEGEEGARAMRRARQRGCGPGFWD